MYMEKSITEIHEALKNKEVTVSELIKENSDTVGWIFVDSSNINYPVVQTSDNDFYLIDHNLNTIIKKDKNCIDNN